MTVTFFVDHMLGRLARWVRFMGFHAKYASSEMEDTRIAEICREDSLVLLSRDRNLCSMVKNSVYIRSVKLEEQLKQFASIYSPAQDSVMRICPVCDGDLEGISAESSGSAVPESVSKLSTSFWKCSSCGKVYWNGTHYDKIIRKISELAGAEDES